MNAGQILFHNVRQPQRWYCPSASSMKNSGIPPKSSITQLYSYELIIKTGNSKASVVARISHDKILHTLTAAILIADVREPPDIAQVYREPHHSQQELRLLGPGLTLPRRITYDLFLILVKVLTLLVVAGGSGGGAVGAGGASEGGISDGSHSPLRRSGPGLSPCKIRLNLGVAAGPWLKM
ncbi:hypothetical protein HW555_013670 [Spodoptera exigua]|uniref:Uncharacterized protein n=1 Tax=Spodoptera exigua TaxID=7107 RepID=A0A835G4X8_SPOEX|nr:hypothetical protein HW555_013670 [Spodoptera exigua]